MLIESANVATIEKKLFYSQDHEGMNFSGIYYALPYYKGHFRSCYLYLYFFLVYYSQIYNMWIVVALFLWNIIPKSAIDKVCFSTACSWKNVSWLVVKGHSGHLRHENASTEFTAQGFLFMMGYQVELLLW